MYVLYLTFSFVHTISTHTASITISKEQSQTLRSALNEKARKAPSSGGSGGSTKPKRKMKPGQAKTLSDLPQLSA